MVRPLICPTVTLSVITVLLALLSMPDFCKIVMATGYQSGDLFVAFDAHTTIRILVDMERMDTKWQTGQVRRTVMPWWQSLSAMVPIGVPPIIIAVSPLVMI